MFLVLLKFSDDKGRAAAFMEGHKEWIARGFDDGVFLVAGSLPSGLGGGILAHGMSRSALDRRVSEDPFVAEQIVNAEIVEIAPGRTDPRLAFLRE